MTRQPILSHGAPNVPSLWTMLWGVVGVIAEESSALWAKLHQSRDPHCIAWRYSIARYMELFANGQASDVLPAQFLAGPWAPRVVVDSLERLVIDQILSRRDATRFEEIVLRQMNDHGYWRFRRTHPEESPQKMSGFKLLGWDSPELIAHKGSTNGQLFDQATPIG